MAPSVRISAATAIARARVSGARDQPERAREGFRARNAQDELPQLSTNSSHRVLPAATHTSIISGVDAKASSQAILDAVTSLRTGTAVR